jgi:hypothetical protein
MILLGLKVLVAGWLAATVLTGTARAESSGGVNLCGGSFMSSYRQYGMPVDRYSAASATATDVRPTARQAARTSRRR